MGICHLLWFPPLIREREKNPNFLLPVLLQHARKTLTPAPLSTHVTHHGGGGVRAGRDQKKDNQQLPEEPGMDGLRRFPCLMAKSYRTGKSQGALAA